MACRRLGVFVGQGAQRVGMAGAFLKDPTFRGVVEECSEAYLRCGGGFCVSTAMETCEGVDDTVVAQPLLAALQIALSTSHSKTSSAPFHCTVGHSLGEVAAAHQAGILTTHEAMALVYYRAQCLQNAKGEMAVVLCNVETASSVLKEAGLGEVVSVAAANDLRSTTISGASVSEARGAFKGAKIPAKMLPVKYAFHSPLVTEEAMRELEANLVEHVFKRDMADVMSQATGVFLPTAVLSEAELVGGGAGGAVERCLVAAGVGGGEGAESVAYKAQYWAAQVRNPVAFHTGMTAAMQLVPPPQLAVEVSPFPTLTRAITAHLPLDA